MHQTKINNNNKREHEVSNLNDTDLNFTSAIPYHCNLTSSSLCILA